MTVITPQNIYSIFNSDSIPEKTLVYVKYNLNDDSYNLTKIKNLSPNTLLKIEVLQMCVVYGTFWMIAGKILSENKTETFYYPRDKFILINNVNNYFCLLLAISKFKILLRRIRNKKNMRLFLLSTTYTPNLLNQSSPLNKFGGASHLPIRKDIVNFITG